MISSAVIVPEPADLHPLSPSNKRRQPSPSYNDRLKRPRLDTQSSQEPNGHTLHSSATSPLRQKSSITGRGAAEERKRGQRLFGALLGTLSQSSSTTAQKRRADIEKKQLGKLQQRDEELEEEKRRKREELDLIRRKEQKLWDEQSMRLQHRNALAEAHFLKTQAEPRLFYKPWDLRSEEEDQIKRQVEDAAKAVEAELAARLTHEESVAEVKAKEVQPAVASPAQVEDTQAQKGPEEPENRADSSGQPNGELVRADTTNEEQNATEHRDPGLITANNNGSPKTQITGDEGESGKQEEKLNDDHGGEELVEGQEDDVIY